MDTRGLMGGLYKITEWITRIAASNILWLICSIPFFFVVINKILLFQTMPNQPETLTYWLMAVLAPVTLFPATSALFAVTRKWVMGEEDVSVWRTFFRGYKENYKQSLIGGIFYTLLCVIMIVDYKVYMNMDQFPGAKVIGIVMLIFMFILFISLFNFFSMVVHYHMGIKQIIKNSVLLTMVRPLRMLSTVICAGVLVAITIKFLFLILVGLGSLMAFVAFFNFYGTYTKMQEMADKQNQAVEDKLDDEETDSFNSEEVKTDK
ncbi:YesL family protein [Paenibacillus sp. SN-8-1]|uniref:YesL family protein n=1 Tax=Paenibacillus sp. SN-8-1 TaxID=3435409 RepID=UPI003D9A1F79